MIRRFRLICTGTAAAVLALAGPAAAQDNPATAEQVVEAIDTCIAITEADWIDLRALSGMGWDRVQRSGSRRQVVNGVYEKPGNEAYLVATRQNLRDKQCLVMTRLVDTSAYNTLAQEVSGPMGMPSRQDGFAYTWQRGDHEVTVNPSGDRNAPKAVFVISVPQGETE